jgi:GAF domain
MHESSRQAEVERRIDPRLLKLAAAALSADELHLSLWLVEERSIETLTSHGVSQGGTVFELDRFPLTEHVLTSGSPAQVLASDPSADRAEVALLEEMGQFRALLMLPVVHHFHVVGLLEAYRRQEAGWTPAEVGRSAVVCGQLGAALAGLRAA